MQFLHTFIENSLRYLKTIKYQNFQKKSLLYSILNIPTFRQSVTASPERMQHRTQNNGFYGCKIEKFVRDLKNLSLQETEYLDRDSTVTCTEERVYVVDINISSSIRANVLCVHFVITMSPRNQLFVDVNWQDLLYTLDQKYQHFLHIPVFIHLFLCLRGENI